MKVTYNNLSSQYATIKDALLPDLEKCFIDGNFILGQPVNDFEKEFAKWVGAKFAVGVSNGTDAIKLALKSFELSDDLIIFVQANTYISTVLAAKEAYPKADIVCIDIDKYLQIDFKHLEFTIKRYHNIDKDKILLVTHMFGGMTDMRRVVDLAEFYNIKVIEDCAQAAGTVGLDNKKVGTYGIAATFSFYPGKNLGAFGDAGAIVTDNEIIYKKLLQLRNLGQEEKNNHVAMGYNHRLDTIQAIVLKHKLPYINTWNLARIKAARYYINNINNSFIQLPEPHPYCYIHTWHTFPILCHYIEALQNWLTKHKIEWLKHYPKPVSCMSLLDLSQECLVAEEFSKYHVSIPIHPFITEEEQQYVCNVLNNFKA